MAPMLCSSLYAGRLTVRLFTTLLDWEAVIQTPYPRRGLRIAKANLPRENRRLRGIAPGPTRHSILAGIVRLAQHLQLRAQSRIGHMLGMHIVPAHQHHHALRAAGRPAEPSPLLSMVRISIQSPAPMRT